MESKVWPVHRVGGPHLRDEAIDDCAPARSARPGRCYAALGHLAIRREHVRRVEDLAASDRLTMADPLGEQRHRG